MAKRNQYNRGAFATPTTITQSCTMVGTTRFLGDLNFPSTTTVHTAAVNPGDTVAITHNGFDHGVITFTNVNLTPGLQFFCSIFNSDWGAATGFHSAFTQLLNTNNNNCYSNVHTPPFATICRLRVASDTATLTSDPVTLFYWVIRSDFS